MLMVGLLTLGDHITTLKGYAFKSNWFSGEGNSIVKVSDFTADTIDPKRLVRIPEEIAKNYQKYCLKTKDVVVQTVGSWPSNPASVVGKAVRVPKTVSGALLNQNAVRIDPDKTIHKDFLYYLLRCDNFKDYIIGTAQGAASQASITLDSIKAYKFECPEYEQQEEIANVLSAYDNLIENNNRRIAILEDMAQSLYREWFVKFRFPGHKNCQFKDSALGQIPEGWGVEKLSDIAEVNPESITKKNAPKEINYVDIKSVNTGSIEEIRPIAFDDAPGRARRKVCHGDTIWATVRPNRKQYSFIAKPRDNMIVSTGFAVLRANQVSPEYLYYAVTTDSFTSYLVNHASGAAYPAVNTKDFENADILVPPKSVLVSFDALVSNSVSESQVLKLKNNNLKQQRDILLPKLISGNISI
jgi:type I restriction enzyme S subunit